MSGDRLAEIEHRARLWAEDDGRSDNAIIELWRLRGRVLGVDALALVEIAKAARDIPDMDTPETDALYRALARLDSGATEGDA